MKEKLDREELKEKTEELLAKVKECAIDTTTDLYKWFIDYKEQHSTKLERKKLLETLSKNMVKIFEIDEINKTVFVKNVIPGKFDEKYQQVKINSLDCTMIRHKNFLIYQDEKILVKDIPYPVLFLINSFLEEELEEYYKHISQKYREILDKSISSYKNEITD